MNTQDSRRRTQDAFTLVELLVVIAIIALLLAMLVPALENATYQAELAVCGSRLKGIGTASFMYANDSKRFYPSRPADYAWDALIMRHPNVDPMYNSSDGAPDGPWDLRGKFMPYTSLDTFVDPGSGNISLDESDNQQVGGATGYRGNVHIYSNYNVYTGWGTHQSTDTYAGPQGNQVRTARTYSTYNRLVRLGDRWNAIEDTSVLGQGSGPAISYDISVIAKDLDNTAGKQGWCMSGHRDPRGEFFFKRYQAEDSSPADAYNPVLGGKFVLTFSHWIGGIPGLNQVKSDYNYAYTDGSVRRYNQVNYADDRMAKVVETSWTEYRDAGRYAQVPKSGN